jgi:hypothetical protein
MTNDLVTIASYASPVEAEIAKNRLESSEIPAFLVGENTVNMAWHLTNAVGGIRLQVSQADADEARAILRCPNEEAEAIPGEPPWANADELDEEPPPLTNREQDADRALRGAIGGLLFWPLQLYVSWLILKVVLSEERLAPIHRRNGILAAMINLPTLSVAGVLLQIILAR